MRSFPLYEKAGTTMKRMFHAAVIVIAALHVPAPASTVLTLQDCRDRARTGYPLTRSRGLIEASENYTVSNANLGYLPQVTLSARATLQSDVTRISISGLPPQFAGMIPEINRDQYQFVGELNQTIWDGGAIASQKKIARAVSAAELRKNDVDLYALNDRVNQLFFGILLFDAQGEQIRLLLDELQSNLDRVSAMYKNGVVGKSDVDALLVEQLNARQRLTECTSGSAAYKRMLAALTGLSPDDSLTLKKPDAPPLPEDHSIVNRPELDWFGAQEASLASQKSAVVAANFPRLGFFIQGGYGQPGLNMFKEGFSPYWLGGFRLIWNLSSFTTRKNNLLKIDCSRNLIAMQQEAFLLNLQLQSAQQNGEIAKYRDLIADDDAIIGLRASIKAAAQAKVDNGTATVTDLIREINAENQARQVKALHEIHHIMSIYNLKNSLNE